ncbi:unnamed protein product [Penicillium nalgiovense]|uniref:Calcineurin-like phosphoesterase domain-containing protein n=1 Tax=Penicillium nalgiovense TaxID=60175 RepID=A0A9W4HLC7_PENNA|nr:unnamed protein product [Penicillium nalgiovense]CAG8019705.1 unnamed protein product [Penicillium nalgiovense]CAG8021828.1 unnamed protein product [Penicillium nalgiovense]CAG8024744.1 unnamed protein product [Penicillium nalgiovense]CAG8054159.1 unnamed protein product [Penicillium nalgiovense]
MLCPWICQLPFTCPCFRLLFHMFEGILSIFDKSSASFQVLSDLHLEVYQQYLSFEIPTDRFELVFLILGNHEFYSDTFAAGLQRARQLEKEHCLNGRLILLHQGRYDIPGSHVTILGCTLWSRVPDEARDIVCSRIQDFKKILDWSVNDHNGSHEADLAWLLSEIESIQSQNKTQKQKQSKKQSVLVVTYHAPSLQGTSTPQHANNAWSSAFATDILSQISKSSGIKVWVFGHTLYTTEFRNQGIRVVANQRGYVLPWTDSKGSKDGFVIGKVIHV